MGTKLAVRINEVWLCMRESYTGGTSSDEGPRMYGHIDTDIPLTAWKSGLQNI